ncbi:Conserved hypothetical protein [gamma proteobacterium HdN1]|nr:Conserved hypothetical protein [gamma proteobacterium HdN1]
MKQQQFEEARQAAWSKLEHNLRIERQSNKENPKLSSKEFIQLYRQTCHDLAVAQQRRYSPYLIDRLNRLVMAGHQALYQRKTNFVMNSVELITHQLPQAIRSESRYFWLAAALFFGPGIFFGASVFFFPQLIYTVFDAEQIRQFTDTYNPERYANVQAARDSASDFQMFGFYIRNNIGIAFQTFAGGIAFGIGTVFFLIYNGVVLGGVAGYLTQLGHINSFYSFVISHGAFELTGIAMAGCAGFRLATALLMPGNLPRLLALQLAAKHTMPIVYGTILFLSIAAFIEAFWSSSHVIPSLVKYLIGCALWASVIFYLVHAGRSNGSEQG